MVTLCLIVIDEMVVIDIPVLIEFYMVVCVCSAVCALL